MIAEPEISVDEDYARATRSSDLSSRGRTDLDALIAAGLLAAGGPDRATAVALYRCCATQDLSDVPAILSACDKWLAARCAQRGRSMPAPKRMALAGKVIGWWVFNREAPPPADEHAAWLIEKLDRLSAALHDDLCRLLSKRLAP